jgi:hypothetical protein
MFITVIGETENISQNKNLQNLSQSLVKAAQLTGAWILTCELNLDLMKYIGEAIKENSYYSKSSKLNDDENNETAGLSEKIVVLGILKGEYKSLVR